MIISLCCPCKDYLFNRNLIVDAYDNNQGEAGTTRENDAFTLQSSFLGSISTMQLLFDGQSEESASLILSDEQQTEDSDMMKIVQKAGNICDIFLDTESIHSNQDDSEYWIVGEESEMNDGWLVVNND